jgi:hypothetical protein
MPKYNPALPSANYDAADYNALMGSVIPAALRGTEGMRFDSEEDASIFFARELDYIKSQSYDVLYPEFTALEVFPSSSEINPGAETTTYYSYDRTGLAKIISNYATDLPRADVKGKPITAIIKSLGDSYGYSVQEMRASRFAGKSLDTRKGEAARYQIDRLNNVIAWVGDEEAGLVGVLSPGTDIPLYTLSQNAAGNSTRFRDKSAQEVLDDINQMQEFVSRITMNVERPDTLVVPTDTYLHLTNTPRSDASDLSIAGWVLANAPYLKGIVPASELNANSGINPYGDQGVALLFKNDKSKLTIENPLPFYQYPLQPNGLEVIIPCEARTAGAIIYYPLSLLIAVGI